MAAGMARLTSLSGLTLLFLAWTALAAAALGPLDARAHHYFVRYYTPQWEGLIDATLNRVGSQLVAVPVLALVALTLSVRHRTWRPLLLAAAAEAAFVLGVGGAKLLLARPSPVLKDTRFFHGGVLADGWYGISYPSGHAAESVLLYGTAAYLLGRWLRVGPRGRLVLGSAVALLVVNAVVTAFYLGWHWPSDLVGGVLAGGMLLRLVVTLDRRAGSAPACRNAPRAP